MVNILTSEEDDGFLENLREADWGNLTQNVLEAFRDEFTGIDDYTRAFNYAKKGNFLKAAKSFFAGNFELGSTIATFGIGTGGLAAAKGGLKGGQAGLKAAKAAKAARVAKAAEKITPSVAINPAKLASVLRGLTLDEQVAAKALSRAGAKRGIARGAKMSDIPIADEAIAAARQQTDFFKTQSDDFVREALQKRAFRGERKNILANEYGIGLAPDAGKVSIGQRFMNKRFGDVLSGVGTGRGGMVGSLGRGAAGFVGGFPQQQGMLARSAFKARQLGETPSLAARAGEKVSGKVFPSLSRTGYDPLSAAMAQRRGPQMTPYGITQQQYDSLSRSLTPAELQAVLIVLQQQAQQGAANG